MPKNTFLNLKEEKKNRIIESALDEFSVYTLSDASVNRIIKNAGIAVGSFYQYFVDIEDLYCYIFRILISKKNKFVKSELDSINKKDFESTLKAAYIGGMKFALSDRRFFDISNNFFRSDNATVLSKIKNLSESIEIENYTISLINNAIDNGEIKKGISAEFILQLLTSANTLMLNEVIARKNGKLNESDYAKISDTVLDLILNGISWGESNPYRFILVNFHDDCFKTLENTSGIICVFFIFLVKIYSE